ncbi:MAG: gephyrin-like molybdotransferase Glp [Alphaproteobacteria bacterium]
MISVDEARARILAGLAPVAAEQVGVAEAWGRVLAGDVTARVTQPPLDVSAMDGWAVRGADVARVPARLKAIGEVPAGARAERPVGPGETMRIFTGAPLPDGADAVVLQEDADRDGDTVTVREGVAAGRHVRRAGLDFAAGDTPLRAGRVLSARDVGLVAAMNVPWLLVRRRPRVAILATGDEIVLPGEPTGPTRIVSSNSFALAALVRATGGEPVVLGIARDDAASLKAMASGAHGADMLVTTGGASVGDHDLVQSVLGEVGLAIDFWQIAMRPGKPLMSGRFGAVPMLGLPGNPVSSMVCAVLFLRPALEALLGVDRPAAPPETALLGRDLPANDRREDYMRASLGRNEAGDAVATPFTTQDSSNFSRLALGDCLVIRPPHAPAAQTGTRVPILRLGGALAGI